MRNRTVRQIDAIPKPATFKETTKAVMRVAAYARVSTDHEDQQSSLEAQTDYYEKKINYKLARFLHDAWHGYHVVRGHDDA